MDLTSYIASMSVSMAQANVAQSVSTAMLSKSIDTALNKAGQRWLILSTAPIFRLPE